ncbi:MAG: tRNA pseudouridine(13) synthase TruD, partial [Planctomycetota bacterium]|nr:tRNA pseudouridine(13) synthase TruD [Planctomycetota bacterium]
MTCSEPPFLTSDVPGVGGQLRQRDTDFFVEEIPLYEPAGQGEHIYLFVEKRGLSTSQLVHLIARHFGVRPSAVGYAGMKDKHAVTRQIISVHTPRRTHADFPMLENERVTVLNASMHANKLRLGHLRGNRFVVRIRGVDMSKAVPALRVLRTLETMGVPNFAGEQRFGSRQNNHRLGLALIRKEWRPLLDELLGPDPAFPHINADARALYAQRQ